VQLTTEAYVLAKYKLRQRQAGAGDASEPDLIGQAITIKELEDVIVKDVGGALATAGGCAAVVDVSKRASVFFRYMDSNYMSASRRSTRSRSACAACCSAPCATESRL
jgi:hypothetical protein